MRYNREKQYNYYRNLLFNYAANGLDLSRAQQSTAEHSRVNEIKLIQYVFGFVSLELKNVCKIKNGSDWKSLKSGSTPVYGSGGIIGYVDTCSYNKPSVLIPRKGSIEKLYYTEKPFWNVDTIFYTIIDEVLVIPKYLFYLLQKEHLEQYNTAGGVPSLTQAVLNDIKIQIPPIEEQKRVVNILDRFDMLCNDISKGLPAEIEMRQKQYEYYRDKLLSF